jgi:hypothetical protein
MADDNGHAEEDQLRVPTAEQTATAVAQAQRALAELEQRDALDEQQANEEERDAQLAQWHADDQAAKQQDVAAEQDNTPVLDRAGARE